LLSNDVIEFVSSKSHINAAGDTIEVPEYRMVYANKKGINQSEFYQAAAVGLKPEVRWEIRALEYQGEEHIRYNGEMYKIIRTYEKNGEFIEIICSGVVNSGKTET